MINIFEEFLEEKFLELFPGVLDDDIADRYDGWLGNMDGEEYIVFADEFRRMTVEKLIEDVNAIKFRISGFGDPNCNDAFAQGTAEAAQTINQQLRAKWLGNNN